MKAETAMAAALKAAGYEAWAELYRFTANFLRDAKGNRTKATDKLFNTVREDKALLRELCAHYVDKVADDMKGLPGEGHQQFASGQPMNADARQQNGSEAGHTTIAHGRDIDARSLPADRDGRGLTPAANGQGRLASPARERSKDEKLRILKLSQASAAKVLMKIDGVDIRDYTIGQALSAARSKDTEVYVLRVLGMMYKHLSHTTRIGDVASDDTIESIIRQGKEYAHAA